MRHVGFTRMDRGTAEDYALALAAEKEERHELPERVLGLLLSLDREDTCFQVTRYEHSLQTATRALRDGADDDLVVCALLHDVGDLLAPDNHGAFAASLLQPYVSERNAWIVRHHGLFQGYYYFHHWGRDRDARERFRDHPWFEDCEAFCERWDQVSFDPNYDTETIEAFEPLVRRVFMREPGAGLDQVSTEGGDR
jgi:predicted HD phosphohydrolase